MSLNSTSNSTSNTNSATNSNNVIPNETLKLKPVTNFRQNNIIKTPKLIENPFQIPDNRTHSELSKGQFFEVEQCVKGTWNCLETPEIANLLPPRVLNSTTYKKKISDFKTHTSPVFSKFNVQKNIVQIQAFNEYNQPKTIGGDFWIARIRNTIKNNHNLIISSKKIVDWRNGSYTVEFPNVVQYQQFFNLSIEIWLERSTEMVEVIRRGMSSMHPTGRWMSTALVEKGHKLENSFVVDSRKMYPCTG